MMGLIKTSILNGVAVVIRVLSLLFLNKILAVYVGPSGYALIGQLQNSLTMITTFASGAINNGVVKYTAQYYKNESEQVKLWRTATAISIAGSFFISIFILVFSKTVSSFFFETTDYNFVFTWFSITLIFFVLNSLLLSIINGKREVLLYVKANISNSLFVLFFTGFLTYLYGINGALIALATNQSLTFFVTLCLCRKLSWFKLSNLFGSIDVDIVRNLLYFSGMAFISAVCVPLSQLFIRDFLTDSLGIVYAGYWEAAFRLSAAYLMIVTTTLSVYYLPRLSEISQFAGIKSELIKGYMVILPVVMIMSLTIYTLKDFIIIQLFSEKFLPVGQLLKWQLIGDVVKIASWLIGYLMISKAMTKLFVISEVVFTSSLCFLTVYFVSAYGFAGVSIAYLVNFTIYFIVISFFVLRFLRNKMD